MQLGPGSICNIMICKIMKRTVTGGSNREKRLRKKSAKTWMKKFQVQLRVRLEVKIWQFSLINTWTRNNRISAYSVSNIIFMIPWQRPAARRRSASEQYYVEKLVQTVQVCWPGCCGPGGGSSDADSSSWGPCDADSHGASRYCCHGGRSSHTPSRHRPRQLELELRVHRLGARRLAAIVTPPVTIHVTVAESP